MSKPLEESTAESKISLCEEALQYRFRDRGLLELAPHSRVDLADPHRVQ